MSTIRRIAVVGPSRNKYSETFIQDSFDFFPCEKWLCYGDYAPTHATQDWRTEGLPIPCFPPPLFQPDLVLAHYGPTGLALLETCELQRLPLVVHFHGYDAFRSDILARYGSAYPRLFARTQAVICSSADMERQLLRLGAIPDRLHLCVYGVDATRFEPIELPSAPFTFLFVGRMVEKKWPTGLLQAFATARAQAPSLRLKMIGDGPLLADCIALADQLGLQGAVEFLGVQPPTAVALALRTSHALVQPSRLAHDGDSEGTPVSVLEAMAAARPVIGSRHAGIAEVILQDRTGLLVPPGQVQDLAQAMLKLASDPEQAARMGTAARAHAIAHHNQLQYHQNLWRILNHAMWLGQNS